jgi:hypothetical protein
MSTIPLSPSSVTIEREGPILYLDVDGVQVALEDGDDAQVTLTIPVAILRALRVALNHPQIVAILAADAPTEALTA